MPINASSSSFPTVVENVGVVMEVLEDALSLNITASVASVVEVANAEVKVTPVTFAPFTVTPRLVGVKV